MLGGLVVAGMIATLAREFYQQRNEISERIKFIRDRNYKSRHAVEAIKLVPYPTDHQDNS